MPKHVAYIFILFSFAALSQEKKLNNLYTSFLAGYQKLGIPNTELDYKANFANIKPNESLKHQEKFFSDYSTRLSGIDSASLNREDKIKYKHLAFELNLNLERIALEKKWNENKTVPINGLYSAKEWYAYYVKHFTGVTITPEEVFNYGLSEVKRIQNELDSLRIKLNFSTEEAFYSFLKKDSFNLHSKKEILAHYRRIDSTVRKNLLVLFPEKAIPPIEAMEWPDAGVNTPPGIYLSKSNNSYGVDIFQFNFYNSNHNIRSMDWLYMHEAIPGHHLQSTYNQSAPASPFFYFGTLEGWACYIEQYGRQLGLYQNDYSYIGLLQWDLVRSARLVMEVGIHYYGWSPEKASSYWKENIKGQDEIAAREIKRITDWPAQSLCYKIGAHEIKKIVNEKIKKGFSVIEAHEFLLLHSQLPLFALH